MKRSRIVSVHIIASIIAVLTISSFFCFSLTAELIGDDAFIKQVKTGILYCLPVLIMVMPTLALSGKTLAGNSKNPLVIKKMTRMKIIALNGLILITLAIYLYYHAIYKFIDTTFYYIQMVELFLGALNLGLIVMNINTGLKLSVRRKKTTR